MSEERREYIDGQIYAMAGESLEHGIICVNLVRIISTQLFNRPCQTLSKDIKVRSGPVNTPSTRSTKGLSLIPMSWFFCGEPLFHNQYRDVLLNPQLIIELHSEATEAYDRGQKFFRYREWLPSLTDYLLISQRQPLIELFRRGSDG